MEPPRLTNGLTEGDSNGNPGATVDPERSRRSKYVKSRTSAGRSPKREKLIQVFSYPTPNETSEESVKPTWEDIRDMDNADLEHWRKSHGPQ